MNTKLNMGVIEDKSITYSKLADDVAESITATMTGSAPDWNAMKGEAGYIKNKPITKNFIKEQSMEFNEVDEWTSIYEGYEAVPSNTTVAKVFVDITTDRGEHITTTVIVKKGESVDIDINKTEEWDYLSISMYDTQGKCTMNVSASFVFSGTLRCYYYEEFKQLDEDYIPDSIARKSEFTTINGQSITEGGNIDLVADGDEVSSLTLKPGCKIGSFSVDSDNNLSSHDVEHIVISNNSISISSDDYVDFTTIKDGRLQIVSEREDMPAMSIAGPNGIEIADPLRNQFDGYAIRAYDGMFAGLRPWVRVINDSSSSSDKTLTELDHTILIYTSSQQTIVLPNKPKDGQEYDILMSLTNSTSVKHVISSNSTNIFVPKEGNLKSSLSVDAHGYIKLIYVKDSGFWWYYRMA